MTNSKIDPNLFIQRISPDYPEDEAIVYFQFATKSKFEEWLNDVAEHHANWIIRQRNVHQGNAKTVAEMSEQHLRDSCILTKETTFYICDHGRSKSTKKERVPEKMPPTASVVSKQTSTTAVKKRRIVKPSIKVDCPAKFKVTLRFNGQADVEYHWKHEFHDPLDIPDIASSRLPEAIKNWIKTAVESNMDWKAIKKTLRLSEEHLDEFDISKNFPKIPAGLIVKYSDVQNVILARMNGLSRKHKIDKESVRLWLESLQQEKQYATLFDVGSSITGAFLVAWMSPWQKSILEMAEEWCIDSTHKTCKSFIQSSADCYLYTIVVRNNVTNKGVPVCFFIANREVTPVLVKWLEWVKNCASVKPKRIMIDCSATEMEALRLAFEGQVDILFCHWHIKRDWEKHLKTDVKVATSTDESVRARDSVRLSINELMQASSPENFDTVWDTFVATYSEQFPDFVRYFKKKWIGRKTYWSKAWRTKASFHTNNMIESYHNQLKSFYLTKSRNKRVDRVVYVLTKVVICDYRSEHIQVEIGVKAINLSIAESNKKRLAEEIEVGVAQKMVASFMSNDLLTFTCRSFTTEGKKYQLVADATSRFIASCNCPDISGFCEHMFLVSRTHLIPFYDLHAARRYKGNNAVRESNHTVLEELSSVEESKPDNSNDCEEQKEARLDILSESLEQSYSLLGGQIRQLNDGKNRNPDFMESLIQDIKTLASKIENTRNPFKYPETQRR